MCVKGVVVVCVYRREREKGEGRDTFKSTNGRDKVQHRVFELSDENIGEEKHQRLLLQLPRRPPWWGNPETASKRAACHTHNHQPKCALPNAPHHYQTYSSSVWRRAVRGRDRRDTEPPAPPRRAVCVHAAMSMQKRMQQRKSARHKTSTTECRSGQEQVAYHTLTYYYTTRER